MDLDQMQGFNILGLIKKRLKKKGLIQSATTQDMDGDPKLSVQRQNLGTRAFTKDCKP